MSAVILNSNNFEATLFDKKRENQFTTIQEIRKEYRDRVGDKRSIKIF